ncbi:RidA family protein [Streptomyces sp. NPDC088923]|uniref:RidA family protein n=1 Tax=Streptomyces sp. NPDC088923 TaxID=3365913 RepID=UPI00380EEF32
MAALRDMRWWKCPGARRIWGMHSSTSTHRDSRAPGTAAAHGHSRGPAGVAPGAGYRQVVSARGRLVAVAGQIALDEYGGLVGAGDASAQARQVFRNIGRCLAAEGARPADLVKLTYFVTDIGDLPAVRKARDAFLGGTEPPASTAVQVAALFRPDLLLEVEALAVVPEDEAARA